MNKRQIAGQTTLAILATVLVGCSLGPTFPAFQHTDPSEYYLFIPENLEGEASWPLLVAIHGEQESGLNCFKEWKDIAKESGIVLLCPTLPLEDDTIPVVMGESTLAGVLSDLYGKYPLAQRFSLAGYSTGGGFAVSYAYRYPAVIMAVAVISTQDFPRPVPEARDIPILVLVGAGDNAVVLEAATAFVESNQDQGFPVRMLELAGVTHQLSEEAIDNAFEFIKKPAP